ILDVFLIISGILPLEKIHIHFPEAPIELQTEKLRITYAAGCLIEPVASSNYSINASSENISAGKRERSGFILEKFVTERSIYTTSRFCKSLCTSADCSAKSPATTASIACTASGRQYGLRIIIPAELESEAFGEFEAIGKFS